MISNSVYKELWRKILQGLAEALPANQVITWFSNSAVLSINDGVFNLGVPTSFARDWIANRYVEKILDIAKKYAPDVQKLEVVIDGALADPADGRAVKIDELQNFLPQKKIRKLPNKQEIKIVTNNGGSGNGAIFSRALNPKYTLDNFIVGKDNRLAHAASMAVSNRPGSEYNPLFIYGGVGLGKTHLLQAVGNEILKNFPDKIVVYITSEQFMNEIVAAIQKFQAREFKLKYRSVDCFIVDDIQFIAQKDRTQEEFFHTFNELYHNGRQIILSSDRPPKELAGIDDRLKSRFGSGMVVEVYFPDYETRIAILQRKCQEQGVILPSEVIEFIASNSHESIRELEGILTQAIAETKLENSTPTIRSLAARLFKMNKNGNLVGISAEEVSRKLTVRTPEDVIQLVAGYFRIPSHEIIGQIRRKEVLIPRQLAMYLIYEILHSSLDSIGHYFGGKNHTTVLHACNKIRIELQSDKKLVADMHALKKEMGL